MWTYDLVHAYLTTPTRCRTSLTRLLATPAVEQLGLARKKMALYSGLLARGKRSFLNRNNALVYRYATYVTVGNARLQVRSPSLTHPPAAVGKGAATRHQSAARVETPDHSLRSPSPSHRNLLNLFTGDRFTQDAWRAVAAAKGCCPFTRPAAATATPAHLTLAGPASVSAATSSIASAATASTAPVSTAAASASSLLWLTVCAAPACDPQRPPAALERLRRSSAMPVTVLTLGGVHSGGKQPGDSGGPSGFELRHKLRVYRDAVERQPAHVTHVLCTDALDVLPSPRQCNGHVTVM